MSLSDYYIFLSLQYFDLCLYFPFNCRVLYYNVVMGLDLNVLFMNGDDNKSLLSRLVDIVDVNGGQQETESNQEQMRSNGN